MSDMSEPSEAGSPTPEPTTLGDRDNEEQHVRKRRRVRLSCLECRRRKLSCDRGFPCERCIKSGTPEACTYESRPGLAPPAKNGISQSALSSRLLLPGGSGDLSLYRRDSSRETDRIRRLELEVAQLKTLLTRHSASDESTTLNQDSPYKVDAKEATVDHASLPCYLQDRLQECCPEDDELRFFRGKEFKTRYYGPHSAFMAFSELTGLTPFMKETAEEWLKPLYVHHGKDRTKRKKDREELFLQADPELEGLLPAKEEADALVAAYIDQFEQLHRIVHVPSFRREYERFWDPSTPRQAAFSALLLTLMSISNCLVAQSTGKLVGLVSRSHHMAEKWIAASDEWLSRQSKKHRRLIHYQIGCMLYLAKRASTVKKKRFWTGAGALIQDAISVGLHRDPGHRPDRISVYNQEMRRRLWAAMQEFDMQASFDYGLPTLLGSLHYDVERPANLDDDEFDEDSVELPPSRPQSEYTSASFQHLSRQSMPLRLRLSRLLNGPLDELDYDQVIRYTNDITQEIDALPSWDVGAGAASDAKKQPLLAYTLLHLQLRQYIIPLHQPFLKLRKSNSRFQYSETVYYNAARDMVLLHDKLSEQGIRALNYLREDALTLAINLCNVTMLQPRGSTNLIMVNAEHTVALVEKCLALKEDRIMRCGNNEPWGYSIMCAAFSLLEAHLGRQSSEAAKARSAERFINIHYKLLAGQDPPSSNQGQQWGKTALFEALDRSKSVTPFPSASQSSAQELAPSAEVPPTPWWLTPADPTLQFMQPMNPDFSLELLGSNLNTLWGDYSWEDPH